MATPQIVVRYDTGVPQIESQYLEDTPVAPVITTTGLPDGIVGTAYSQTIQYTGSTSTFAVQSGSLPDGLTLSSAGVLSGTPTTPVAASFTLRATNASGFDDQALTLHVPNEGTGGDAPVVTTVTLVPATASVRATETTALTVTVEDQDGNPIQGIAGTVESDTEASATVALDGATDANGEATATVTGVAVGSAGIVATFDGVASNSAAITVTAAPVAPTITTTTVPDGSIGIEYSKQIVATGDSPITFAVQSGALPDGLLLNPSTGVITGTPTTEEAASFTIRATNAEGFDDQAFTMNVVDTSPSVVTTVSLAASATILAGQAQDVTVTVTDQNGAPMAGLTGSVSSSSAVATGSLLAVTNASGQATLRITAVSYGSATLTVDFSGVEATISVSVTTTVTISPDTATVAPSATQAFSVSVLGDATPAVTWAVVSGGGSITSGGVYTAPSYGGAVTVRVTYTASGDYDQAVITVTSSTNAGIARTTWKFRGRPWAHAELDYAVFDSTDQLIIRGSGQTDGQGALELNVGAAYSGQEVVVAVNNVGASMETAGKVHGQQVVQVA